MTKVTEKTHNNELKLNQFKLDRILFNDSAKKTIGLLGKFENISDADQGIVILEKLSFAEEHFTSEVEEDSFLKNANLEEIFRNDIYGNYYCFAKTELNKLKSSIIYPATEKHINKYSKHESYLVLETPEMYENSVLKHLESEQFSLEWVYNILEHKKEVERIVLEDNDPENGFILLPDFKWDGKTKETLYLLAIIQNRSIKSIRDLRENHIPLLLNMKDSCLKAIEKKYGVQKEQIRAYFHYQPSFYHLHVHFTYLKYDAPGIFCEKSHLIDTVIQNIQLLPDYYLKATLPFVVNQNDKLYESIMNSEPTQKKLKLTQ
ncbi:unnamed protein product [Diamesa serratosioi]